MKPNRELLNQIVNSLDNLKIISAWVLELSCIIGSIILASHSVLAILNDQAGMAIAGAAVSLLLMILCTLSAWYMNPSGGGKNP